MRWEDQRRSGNVEDRRGLRVPGGAAGGGIGTIVIVLLISWVTGVNPMTLFQVVGGLGGGASAPVQEAPTGAPSNDPQAEFAAVVLADTEDTWSRVFQQAGERYQPPTLVLFSDAVQSACGTNSAAVGPFYCPGDQKVYIDLVVLPRTRSEVRRARRLRPGLRHRPRSGPPSADAARRVGEGDADAPAGGARRTPTGCQ